MRKLLFESLIKRPLTEAPPTVDDAALTELAEALGRQARKSLGRSLSIREVDAGSCNGCELEIHALNNAYYDIERFGLRFVASPRHADVLMVTGPVTKNMREALQRTYNAMPAPKWVVAIGDCALDGGCFAGSYAVPFANRGRGGWRCSVDRTSTLCRLPSSPAPAQILSSHRTRTVWRCSSARLGS
ncbi:MAG: hydrogenase [Alphaproteobacteria bacterium]|nr:hydrogenase [Alphaproteobacteria bacterium]